MNRTGLALSVQQPWAWLIAHGYKDIENRSWYTPVRGRFGIHAGKKIDAEGLAWVRRTFPEIPLPSQFELGGIIGSAVLLSVVTTSESKWFFGPKGFVMSDQEPLPFIPCRGQLGFFRPVISGAANAQG